MTIGTVFLVLALVCFILGAANNVGQPVQFGWLGMAFLAVMWLIEHH